MGAMATIAEQKNTRNSDMRSKLPLDKILSFYASNENILKSLDYAVDRQAHYEAEVPFVNGTLKMNTKISEETGLWELRLTAPRGEILYETLDDYATQIRITSIPDISFIEIEDSSEELSDALLLEAQRSFTRTFDLDLSDVRSVRKCKDFFKGDFVLEGIRLNNPTLDTADRMIIWHIRAFRKVFLRYLKDFSFIWEKAGFKTAKSLKRYMEENRYLEKREK